MLSSRRRNASNTANKPKLEATGGMRRINRTGSSKDVKMDYKNLRRGSKVDTDMSLSSDMEDFDLEEADKYEDKLNEYQRQRDTRMGTSMGTATRQSSMGGMTGMTGMGGFDLSGFKEMDLEDSAGEGKEKSDANGSAEKKSKEKEDLDQSEMISSRKTEVKAEDLREGTKEPVFDSKARMQRKRPTNIEIDSPGGKKDLSDDSNESTKLVTQPSPSNKESESPAKEADLSAKRKENNRSMFQKQSEAHRHHQHVQAEIVIDSDDEELLDSMPPPLLNSQGQIISNTNNSELIGGESTQGEDSELLFNSMGPEINDVGASPLKPTKRAYKRTATKPSDNDISQQPLSKKFTRVTSITYQDVQKAEAAKNGQNELESPNKLRSRTLLGRGLTKFGGRRKVTKKDKSRNNSQSSQTSSSSNSEDSMQQEQLTNIYRRRANQRRRTTTKMLSDSIIKLNSNMAKANGMDLNEVNEVTDVWHSDSDYSFESDAHEENHEEQRRQSLKTKKNTKNKSFIGNTRFEYQLVASCYKGEIDVVLEDIKESKVPPLEFEIITEDQKLPENQLERVGHINLHEKITNEHGEIALIKVDSKADQMVVALKNGKILLVDLKTIEIEELPSMRKEVVTAVNFDPRHRLMLIGFENGEVWIFQQQVKQMKAPSDDSTEDDEIKQASCEKVTYQRCLKLYQLKGLNIIIKDIVVLEEFRAILLNTQDGRIFYAERLKYDKIKRIEKSKFSFKLVENGIDNGAVPHLMHKVFRGIDFVVQTLGNTARVYVHRYTLDFKGLEKIKVLSAPGGKPVCFESFPYFDTVQSGNGELKVLCIFWGYHICYYSMYYTKGKVVLPLGGVTELDTRMDYAAQFDDNLYVMIDENAQILQYSLKEHVTDVQGQKDRKYRVTAKFKPINKRRSSLSFNKRLSDLQNLDTQDLFIMDDSEDEDIFGNSEVVMEVSFKLNANEITKIKVNSVNKFQTDLIHHGNSQLFIMTKSGLMDYEMMCWVEYLHTTIHKEKFSFTLKVLNKILERKEIALRGIPKDTAEVEKKLKPIIITLMNAIWPALTREDVEDREESMEYFTTICVMTLIKAGMEDFLLNGFKKKMVEYSLHGFFYSYIFLLFENKILEKMTKEIVEELIEYYSDEEGYIKRMLICIFQYDEFKVYALNKALDMKLFNLAFYLSENAKPEDSVLPLDKLMTNFRSKPEDEKNPFYHKHILFEMMFYVQKVIIIETDQEEMEVIGEEHPAWRVMNWLIDLKNTGDLIKEAAIPFLKIFLYLIEAGLSDEIGKINQELPSVPLRIGQKPKICSTQTSRYLAFFIDEVFDSLVGGELEYAVYWFLMALHLHSVDAEVTNLGLNEEYQEKTLVYMTENLDKLVNTPGVPLNQDDLIIKIFRLFHSNMNLYLEKPALVDKLVKLQSKLKLIKLIMNGETKNCFYLFQRLSLDYKPYIDVMFQWIKKDLEDKKKYRKMYNLLQEEYMYLIKEDHNQFSSVLTVMDIEAQLEFIMKYKPPTKSKLEIFETILKGVKQMSLENEISKEFKIEYINLLNHHKRKKVLPEIMTGKYPLSECLEICQKGKPNDLAVAYLKERLGFYQEALEIYKSRLKKVLKALTRGGKRNSEKKSKPLYDRFDRESKMALDLCIEAENTNKMLFNLMDFLAITEQKYFLISKIQRWVDFEEKVLKTVIELVPEKVFIDKISDTKSYSLMDNNHIMELVLDHFKSLKNMLVSFKMVNGIDFFNSNNKYTEQSGLGRQAYVPKEKLSLKKEAIMLFRTCGHTYDVVPRMIRQHTSTDNNVYCSKCEQTDENVKALHHMLRLFRRQPKPQYPKLFKINDDKRKLLRLIGGYAKYGDQRYNRVQKFDVFDREMEKLWRIQDKFYGERRAIG